MNNPDVEHMNRRRRVEYGSSLGNVITHAPDDERLMEGTFRAEPLQDSSLP